MPCLPQENTRQQRELDRGAGAPNNAIAREPYSALATLRDPAVVDSRQLHVLASRTPRELPMMVSNRSDPLPCRLVVYAKSRQGRKHRNERHPDKVARSSASRKAAAREREPWLIVCSPTLSAPNARQLVNLYARRMQIELSFRDLKSHRYGQGFEDSLTRSGGRLRSCCWSAPWHGSQAGWQEWGARRRVSPNGCCRSRPNASSTRPCVSGAKPWSDAGPWSPYPSGWIGCDHCRRQCSIRWSRQLKTWGYLSP
jgi:hypothetical protein